MQKRANAWARGDLEGLEKLGYANQEKSCDSAVLNSPAFNDESDFKSMNVLMRDAWVKNAEQALESNASTFALLPLDAVLDPQGMVAVLQSKGYTVEKPE
jgi:hypothetical protein